MGLRYQQQPPPPPLADLPDPVRTFVHSCHSYQQRADRGMVRSKNDKTLDSRATRFRNWLLTDCQFTQDRISSLQEAEIHSLVHAYLLLLLAIKDPTTRQPLMATTLCRHLDAISMYLHTVVSAPFSLYIKVRKKEELISSLKDLIDQRSNWQQPRAKREPYTFLMFQALADFIEKETASNPAACLDLFAAVYDWVRLGIFTGSRVGEYAQSTAPKGQYSRVPQSLAAGPWAGKPIAFIAADFEFFTAQHTLIPHTPEHLFLCPDNAFELHITFRFDKSPRNFVKKKYRRGAGIFCPIDAAISIIARAHLLKVPAHEPIGVIRDPTTKKGYTYLRSCQIIKVMRKACVWAYPDENHYMRINVDRIDSHSNRVTAALALRAMGVDIPSIAARLRWKPESVDHYLRECDSMIQQFTHTAYSGAFLLSH